MKKAIILAAVIILGILGMMGWQMYLLLEQQSYDGDVTNYGAAAVESGGITADVDGQSLTLPNELLDGLVSRLTTASTQRKRVGEIPADALESMTLHFGTSCDITLYRLDAAGDATVVRMDTAGRDYMFRLDGYKLFYWVKRIVTQQ